MRDGDSLRRGGTVARLFACEKHERTDAAPTTQHAVGTPSLLLDIDPRPGVPATFVSSPFSFTRFGAQTVFFASTPGEGTELYVIDGTAAGTRLVVDAAPGGTSLGSPDTTRTELNGVLSFRRTAGPSGFELFRTDGEPTGTRLVADVCAG